MRKTVFIPVIVVSVIQDYIKSTVIGWRTHGDELNNRLNTKYHHSRLHRPENAERSSEFHPKH